MERSSGGVVQLRRRDLIRSLAAAALLGQQAPGASRRRTRNVIVFMTDGLRPEEVFTGADAALLEPKLGASDEIRRTLISARAEYGRPTDIERRELLLPFFWKEVGRKGQIWGNRALGSAARVTNGRNFSYPGYSETFCGVADSRIDSNDKKPNPNVNVLEWLAGDPEFRGRISAFTSWDVFPWILNAERSGLPVNSGWTKLPGVPTEKRRLLDRLSETLTRADEGWRYDALTAEAALECLKHDRPRVLFVALDETDGKAHDGNYPAYLRAARAADQVMRDLWETAQSLPSHRGSTTLIALTDHGRGPAPDGWKNHGADVIGAEKIWMAMMGPDTPALGERRNVPEVTQSQTAATIAAALGRDFRQAQPSAAPPLPGFAT